MVDGAHVDTDKKIKKLERSINEVYAEAQADIEAKLNDFTRKYKVKESIHLKELKEGKITQEQFDNWKKGQVFQGKQWQAKRDQIISTIHNSNTIATKIINGATIGVFMNNTNYTAYNLEHSKGVNFGFGIYDTSTVSRLLKDNPDLLPKWKVDKKKDYVWNKKKVNNAITQGIIQGERLDQITNRISSGLAAQNENTMKTFARTAMTGAQNAGREQRLMNLKAKGINVVKQWMATLDGRTRHSHRMMDGETLPVAKDKFHPVMFSNGCRYPGDPEGPAHEVYNCRCTMVGDVPEFPDEYKRYDNVDGKPIKNMTYQEWYKAKYGKELKTKEIINSAKPDNKKEFIIPDEIKNTISAEVASEDWFEYENANVMSSYVETGEMPTEDMYGTILSEETRQKLAAEAELIQNTAISTKTEYKTLYRGMVLDEDEARAMFTPGENFTFNTLTASTPNKDIAKIYMDVNNRGGEGIPVILEIQKGDGIYGFDRDGMETILPKGSQFRVTRNYMDESGVVHVSLYAKKGNNIVVPDVE